MEDGADLSAQLAARLRRLRAERGLTLDGLAERARVSRSMISLIERGESSPTAVVLNRLATALGVTLASLFAAADRAAAGPLARRAEQRTWRDPDSGYLRRNLSPPGYASPLELVEVSLPPGAYVAYDGGPAAVRQQVWLIEGELELTLGDTAYRLAAGDCLAMRIDQPTAFRNPAAAPARYLVALASVGMSAAASG